MKLDYNEDDIQFVMELTGKSNKDSEELILKVYKDIEDDNATIFDILDIIESECNVKKNKVKTVNRKVTKEKKVSKPRTIKTSDEKKELFNEIHNHLTEIFGENVEILNQNKLIQVKINNYTFKIDIIQQKKPKS